MTIAKIKDWVKKHKKGIILVAGSATAAVIGVKVFRDHYYIVPTKNDMFTIAKDSVMKNGIPEAVKQIGDVDLIWENTEHLGMSIDMVPLDKLGEVGKAITDSYDVSGVESIGILVAVPK